MSFTRRVKYGNKIALRKLKKNINSENIDTMGFLFICLIAAFVINTALMGI
jgi:hypothetical protein